MDSSSTVRVPRLLTVREVAQLTGLARWRIYQLVSRGEGPKTLKIGRTLRVSEKSLVEWIEAREQGAHST